MLLHPPECLAAGCPDVPKEGENRAKIKHPKIFIGTINTYDDRMVVTALTKFEGLAKLGRERELRQFLNEFLSEARVTE